MKWPIRSVRRAGGCSLSARNLQTPSEAPSKPYKACRRCSKGSYSAVVEEIGKAVS